MATVSARSPPFPRGCPACDGLARRRDEEAGAYEVKLDGSNLVRGVYFYRIQAGSIEETKEVCVVR